MNTQVATMEDMTKMAAALVKSKLFGFDTPEQAMAIMLIAQAEGRSPALAARDYHVIQGRPALKADAMLARFQQAGGVVEWDVYTDEKVSGRFSHPQSSPKPIAIEWTFDMARKIGLANKDNWKKYPRAMMRARVISEGVRTVYPGIAVGVYTIEEVQDFEEKDVTPDSRKATAGFLEMQPVKRQEQIIEIATGIKSYMANDQTADAYALWQDSKLDNEETIAMWSLLDSKQRGALGRLHEAEKAQAAGTISPAQKKRLEARIGELGRSREAVKNYCRDQFGKEHFADLTKDEYEQLDAGLETIASEAPKAPAPQTPPASPPSSESAGAVATISADEALAIEARCSDNNIPAAKVKAEYHVERFSQMTPQQFSDANERITVLLEKRKVKT